jgi:hypothetical protein
MYSENTQFKIHCMVDHTMTTQVRTGHRISGQVWEVQVEKRWQVEWIVISV